MGLSPWGHKESDMTERLTHTHNSQGKAHVRGGTLTEAARPGQAPQ